MNRLHNLFPYSEPVPANWLAILSLIQTSTGTPTVLAGGALRDHFHAKPVKDIDFFLAHNDEAVQEVNDLFEEMGFECIQSIGLSCEGFSDCRVVLGFRDPMGLTPDVNVIFLDPASAGSVQEIVERLDFGICQIGVFFNEQNEVEFYYTLDFIEDVVKLTFTLRRRHDQERSQRRFERIKEKYPYHRLVVRE
jgi:hypothetical protein